MAFKTNIIFVYLSKSSVSKLVGRLECFIINAKCWFYFEQRRYCYQGVSNLWHVDPTHELKSITMKKGNCETSG